MPPLRQFWLPYAVFGLAAILLGFVGLWMFVLRDPEVPLPPHVPAIYAGGWIALLSLVATTWTSWRTSRLQHTITALQALRTDREYLEAAKAIKRRLPRLGETAPEDVLNELRNPPRRQMGSPDFLGFASSVDFVMNQYEFMAAGVRLGVMDKALLRETIRGVLTGLVITLAPFIAEVRTRKPQTWRNLIWLYDRFRTPDDGARPELGPLP